jgi:PTS system nitrogen regulatory IIA component
MSKFSLTITINFGNVEFTMEREVLMTIDDLASYLRVTKRTIYDWLQKGRIPASKVIGQWRFKKDKIDEWLDQKTNEGS